MRDFSDSRSDDYRASVFFRHDIDYLGCVRNGPYLMQFHEEFGVPLAIFVRADGEEYKLSDARELVKEAQCRGISVGLHTSCYVHEDFLTVLNSERQDFGFEYGFLPTTFTIHGGSAPQYQGRRRQLVNHAEGNLGELGFCFTDCSPAYRSYTYVFQDCDRSEVSGERSLFSDFIAPPVFFPGGSNFLFLAHPSYWDLH